MKILIEFAGQNYDPSERGYNDAIQETVLSLACEIYAYSIYKAPPPAAPIALADLLYALFTGRNSPTSLDDVIKRPDYLALNEANKALAVECWQSGQALRVVFLKKYAHTFERLLRTEPHAPNYALVKGFWLAGLCDDTIIQSELTAYGLSLGVDK